MFDGWTSLNLDAKGRIAIPSRHRESLVLASDGQLILTAHPDGCLVLYPLSVWAPIRAKVLTTPGLGGRQLRWFKRVMMDGARTETLDSAGRLLIAPELRQYADLEKKVWLMGRENRFEIWSDARWQKEQGGVFDEKDLALDGQLPPELEDLLL